MKGIIMNKSLQLDKISLGVCYYPEHWPDEMIQEDMTGMKASGIQYIRIAEFAWSFFEAEEGVFTFDYFDNVLEKALEHGLKVIFCTPTATPPAWLTHKYPEVLNAKLDGTTFQHGHRRHYNYNSKVYRKLSQLIVTKLAQRYGTHEAIVGWQIDNEFNCEISDYYSEADRNSFREFVKNKYKTLEALNDVWGNKFWNQTYSDWDQVSLSKTTIQGFSNPHLMLEEKRFFSHSTIEYCALQSDIIRKYSPDKFVTTNSVFDHLDKHAMTEQCLDFMSFDTYPNFAFEMSRLPEKSDVLFKDRWSSLHLSKVRSISSVFGVMEQQSGACGWIKGIKSPAPKPGQLRLWSFQSIAHGADLVSYFRWRTCTYGTEIYWHGINDYHNQPNRRLEEVVKVSSDIKKIADVTGKEFVAKVGLLQDYDNEWDGELDEWYGPLARHSQDVWFKALQMKHIPVNIIQIEYTDEASLNQYDALIYPHPAILTKERALLLESYVQAGGQIIFGCRTGYKDKFGRCLMKKLPGYAAEMCGINVEDFTLVRNDEPQPTIHYDKKVVKALMFNDILATEGAEVLATYDGSYYKGKAAVTKHSFGKGYAFYHGAAFNIESTNVLIDELNLESPVVDLMELSPNIELAIRGEFVFLLNYTDSPQKISIKKELTDLLDEQTYIGECNLSPYDVVVFATGRS